MAATFAGVSGTVAAPAWAEGAAVSTPPVGPEGHGVTIPDGRNQAVGDVLGLGFEQLIRLNGSKVEITAPSAFGGELLETFEVGAKQRYPRPSTLTGARTYPGLEKLEKVTDRTNEASRLAVAGDAIFVSTILGKDYADPTGSIVQKYVVQHDGDRRVLEKQNEYKLDGANLAVTALDAYVHDGQEYVAAGLNTTGVRILQATAGEPGQLGSFRVFRHVHADWDGRLGWWERDMVTTVQLGTDKQKRLILIAGKITYEHPAIVATDLRAGERVDDTGNHVYLWKNNDRWLDLGDMLNDRFEWPDVVEFGTVGPQETPIVAISWPTRNRTSFLFPDSGVTWNWTDGISPTTAVRYFTDGEGNNRVFVRRAPAGPILGMSAGGQWEFYEDVDDARVQSAVPGYRVWNLTLENQSRHDVTLTPYRGSTRLEGCWYGDDLSTDRPLPATRIDLRAGGAAGPFVTARRTSGAACGNDHPGVLYAQVAPKGAPEQAQIVKLLGDVAGLRLDQEVGAGALTVRTERDGMFDVRLVVTDRHEAPTPVKAPTLTASRLTPAPAPTYKPTDYLDDPTRPVFRFTVTDQRWHVPGADELTNVTLPV
ncbi:MAG: hypothetical protein K0R01_2635, partial [Mycobacterium sp.]|nr:hypothetical protein [Mycobacterium sp.]